MGLDISGSVVGLSQKVIGSLGLEEEIEIIQGDETRLTDLEWDIVLVAAMADPKERIFRNLRRILHEKGRADALVFYRTYTGMKALLHVPVSESDTKGFKTVRTFFPVGRVNNTIIAAKLDEEPGPHE